MANRKGTSDRKCGFCGEVGHYRSTCSKKKERSSPIAVQNDDDDEISQFSPNDRSKSTPKAPERRVLRPRTRSSTAKSRAAVSDNSNDSDFQLSFASVSDLPETLSTQEAEDLAATFQEILNSPPTSQPSSPTKSKKRSKKKRKQKKSSANTPPHRVQSQKSSSSSRYTPLQLRKVQNTSQASVPTQLPSSSNNNKSRPLLPNAQLNQRWFPPPPRRSPFYNSQFAGTSTLPPRPFSAPQYRSTAFSSSRPPFFAASSANLVPHVNYVPPVPPQRVSPLASTAPPRVVAPPLPPPLQSKPTGSAQSTTNFTPLPLETPRPPASTPNPPTQPQIPVTPAVDMVIESPDLSELMQLQELGLNMLFGVSHEKGGGVYLSRREATVAAVRFHNEGHTVAKIEPFQCNDIPLSRLESLVTAWVHLSQPVPGAPDNFFHGTNAEAPAHNTTSTAPGECVPPRITQHTTPHSANPSNMPPPSS